MNAPIDPKAIKAESEAHIQARGGQICDWLPWLDITEMRGSEEICDRALSMNAVIQIAFGAPKSVVQGWLEQNGLLGSLSNRERAILAAPDAALNAQEA